MFALVDCNNFYASCERVFNPKLEGIPIVILSNNDGCIIARSNEAKALGIKMGAPYHEMKSLILNNGVRAFSSNYTLYGDMSARVMSILSEFSPDSEVYSIDECFLGMEGFNNFDLSDYGQTMRQTVRQYTGIPVCVGMGPTKTLAKIANRLAKKMPVNNGVFVIDSEATRLHALANIATEDIWGIGRQYQQKLASFGLKNALELSHMAPDWGKIHLGGVVGMRLIHELNGLSCIDLEQIADPKKNIAATRAFGKVVTDEKDISESLSFHISRAAEKLRAQGSVAKIVCFFFQTNPFSKVFPFVRMAKAIELPVATSDTRLLNAPVQAMFKRCFRPGLRYHKAGVMLQELSPASHVQSDFFAKSDAPEACELMATLDSLNKRFGRGTLQLGSSGIEKSWITQANLRSPSYTTSWKELFTVHTG